MSQNQGLVAYVRCTFDRITAGESESTLSDRQVGLTRARVSVFIKLHITAQPGPVKLIFQCYSMDPPYGGSVVCVCVCVFIKLHITAQPGPVKLIFQCYSNGSALWGISG